MKNLSRKHYIDNLRNLTILLLFPVHTFMIWNNFGFRFYIWVKESRLLSTLIVLINPWFMPLLFVLAGMSARYALEKRTVKEFAIERVRKLLVPFLIGTLLLVPFQTLYARKYFYHYTGGILSHWRYFFTHFTDLSGYDGCFTPGHLWFILFLFFISMIGLIVFRIVPYEKVSVAFQRLTFFSILFMFVPIWGMYYLGNFGGYSIGKSLALFLLGYYLLSNDSVLERLEKNMTWLFAIWIVSTIASGVLYYHFFYYGDLWVHFIAWISILFFLVVGKRFLNQQTRFTVYLNQASYLLYLLHQSILVVLAYYVVQICHIMLVQILVICIGSFALTLLACHLLRKAGIQRHN